MLVDNHSEFSPFNQKGFVCLLSFILFLFFVNSALWKAQEENDAGIADVGI